MSASGRPGGAGGADGAGRLRVGVAGARRARQGTGPFLARAFHRLGCEVTGVSGRSAESAALAARDLEAAHGIRARPYASTAQLLAGERLDVLAIATPAERHEGDLAAALAARVHVLCEKPLAWTDDALDDPTRLRAAVERLARGFSAAGLALSLNAQWPWTLGAFAALHPGVIGAGPPREVALRLSPIHGGIDMVIDSASHPLSLLEALVGPGRVEAAQALWEPDREAAMLRWGYRHQAGVVAARLELRSVPAQPRPAWIEVDGRRAERQIEPASYAMRLASPDGRAVPLPDPLEARVADFVRDLRDGRPGAVADPDALLRGLDGLVALVAAGRAALGG